MCHHTSCRHQWNRQKHLGQPACCQAGHHYFGLNRYHSAHAAVLHLSRGKPCTVCIHLSGQTFQQSQPQDASSIPRRIQVCFRPSPCLQGVGSAKLVRRRLCTFSSHKTMSPYSAVSFCHVSFEDVSIEIQKWVSLERELIWQAWCFPAPAWATSLFQLWGCQTSV